MKNTNVRYANNSYTDFAKDLRKRVNAYFKENKIEKSGNAEMYVKTIFMVLLYTVPFTLVLTNTFASFSMNFLMFIVMGFGMSGIGLSVMHDANHGSYSNNTTLNKWMSRIIYLVGGNPINWQTQHNVLHHTYTNVEGLDQDIDSVSLLRFSPHQKRKKIHKFQFLYAWAFYSLLTVSWMTAKEYVQLVGFNKKNLLDGQPKSLKRLFVELTIAKILYFTVFLVTPMVLSELPAWFIFVSFMCMHFVAGVVLAAIFQTAHVMPDNEFPLPNDDFKLDGNLLAHQLITTTNYAQGGKGFSWFVGGLNMQIEHHLFPNICHVHYRKISPIVKEVALKYNLPYYARKTFLDAIIDHVKMLKYFGNHDELPTNEHLMVPIVDKIDENKDELTLV